MRHLINFEKSFFLRKVQVISFLKSSGVRNLALPLPLFLLSFSSVGWPFVTAERPMIKAFARARTRPDYFNGLRARARERERERENVIRATSSLPRERVGEREGKACFFDEESELTMTERGNPSSLFYLWAQQRMKESRWWRQRRERERRERRGIKQFPRWPDWWGRRDLRGGLAWNHPAV